MKKKLLILFALCAALVLLNYCRTPAPAIVAAPEPSVRLAHNVAVGNGSAHSCYPTADFVLKFSSVAGFGRVTVSIDGEVCAYPNTEVFAESRTSWVGVWDANYVRINADGTTEACIEGKLFTFKPTEL